MSQSSKFLPALTILYVTFMLASLVLGNRISFFGIFVFNVSCFTFPLIFSIGDIVTEVYGYETSRQLLWLGFASQFIFAAIMLVANHFPVPSFWHDQNSYEVVLGHLLRICTSSLAAMILGGFVNIYLVAKWKILLRGKFFWIRSLTATAIGELLFTSLALFLMFFGKTSINHLIMMITTSYVVKIFYNTITIFPISFFTKILKKAEKIDAFDYGTDFNPFKMTISDSAKNKY